MYEDLNENPLYVDLKENFESWASKALSSENSPLNEPVEKSHDLYSFYSELCAFRSEYRKASKRNFENIAHTGEVFEEFNTALEKLSETISGRNENHLPLIDLFTRFDRICEKMEETPEPLIFNLDKKWRENWGAVREALSLLKDHFQHLLKKEGVAQIKTTGETFDPTTMTAVALSYNKDLPEGVVEEEVAPGFTQKEDVIQLAQVKVTTQKEQ